MSPEVVVIGDANVDLVLRGDVVPRFGQAEQLLDAADLTLGGSGAIVACGLARLGHDVSIVAAVGADAFGEFVVTALAESGVSCDNLARRDAQTGISVILTAEDRAILTYSGAIATLSTADVDPDLIGSARHVHAASPYLVTGLSADLPALLSAARGRGVTVSIDTNDDPARDWKHLPQLIDASDVVLPNLAELVRWNEALGAPTHDDWKTAARAVATRGVDVVVKLGREGGAVAGPDGSVIVRSSTPVTPRDTTGAGDSFDAGWISARLRGADHAEALRWAIAAGALSTERPGGTAGQPDQDRIRRILRD